MDIEKRKTPIDTGLPKAKEGLSGEKPVSPPIGQLPESVLITSALGSEKEKAEYLAGLLKSRYGLSVSDVYYVMPTGNVWTLSTMLKIAILSLEGWSNEGIATYFMDKKRSGADFVTSADLNDNRIVQIKMKCGATELLIAMTDTAKHHTSKKLGILEPDNEETRSELEDIEKEFAKMSDGKITNRQQIFDFEGELPTYHTKTFYQTNNVIHVLYERIVENPSKKKKRKSSTDILFDNASRFRKTDSVNVNNASISIVIGKFLSKEAKEILVAHKIIHKGNKKKKGGEN